MSDIVPTHGHSQAALIEREINRAGHLRSEKSRTGYRHDLLMFDDWRAGRDFTVLLVEEYVTYLDNAGYASTSINRALSAIRWWARRLMQLATAMGLPKDQQDIIRANAGDIVIYKNLKTKRLPAGRYVEQREFKALLRICADGTEVGIRDAAVIAVLYGTGMRRSELSALTMHDYQSRGTEVDLVIRESKGDSSRIVPVPAFALKYLEEYLEIRGMDDGPMFVRAFKGDTLSNLSIGGAGIARILHERTKQAGLLDRINPHDLRRSFATDVSRDTNLAVLADLMGHSSTDTTRLYVRQQEESKQEASRKLDERVRKHK